LFKGYFGFSALVRDLRILALEKAEVIECVFDRTLFGFVKPRKLAQGFHALDDFGARICNSAGHEGLFQLKDSSFVQLYPFLPIVTGHSPLPLIAGY